jgi:peptidylprolyl isomerase
LIKNLCIFILAIVIGISCITGCTGSEELIMAKDGDTVKVHYKGTLGDGSVFDTSRDREPLEFILGSGSMIVGFDNAVNGMQVGEIKTVTIPPDEAYGPHREELVLIIERDRLPEGLEPTIGQQLEMSQPNGRTVIVIVTHVSDVSITVDSNHRLAGKDLTFEIELVEIN